MEEEGKAEWLTGKRATRREKENVKWSRKRATEKSQRTCVVLAAEVPGLQKL